MKTEMVMRDNGNYEQIISYIQHKCVSEDRAWECIQYAHDIKVLRLKIEIGDPYEDGFEEEIKVLFCPFCGYKASFLSDKIDN